MTTMHAALQELPVSQLYRLLEPGPVVLLTTRDGDRPNVMTMGFHMMVQHEPPLLACVVGPWDHSFHALRNHGECVIAIPPARMARSVVDIGNCSGGELDKFELFGLTPLPAASVRAPLIAECFANIECRVADARMVADYNLFLLAAQHIWVAPGHRRAKMLHHRGDGSFTVDGTVIDHSERMTKWRSLP